MPDHHTLLELVKISDTLRDALREAHEMARAGENGEPLRKALHHARDLLAPGELDARRRSAATEHVGGMAMQMAAQLAAMEALLGPSSSPLSCNLPHG